MVIGSVGLALVLSVVGAAERPLDEADRAVTEALKRGDYPWYDAKSEAGAFQPVFPPGQEFWERVGRWISRWIGTPKGSTGGAKLPSMPLGELFVIGLVVLALAVFLVILMELWRRHRPVAAEPELAEPVNRGVLRRIEGLPAGVRPESEDPWADALTFRARGDYARAVICLFAHQLLRLERLRLIHLIPGRTGRQLVRALDDASLRRCVEPTLQLFERVYYGHRQPTAEEFEPVWRLAEEFERQIAGRRG